jgi:hypothetical protein
VALILPFGKPILRKKSWTHRTFVETKKYFVLARSKITQRPEGAGKAW